MRIVLGFCLVAFLLYPRTKRRNKWSQKKQDSVLLAFLFLFFLSFFLLNFGILLQSRAQSPGNQTVLHTERFMNVKYTFFIFRGRINPGYKSPEKFDRQRQKMYRMRALYAFKHILFRATFCFAFFQSPCSLLRFLLLAGIQFQNTNSLLIHALEKLYQAG